MKRARVEQTGTPRHSPQPQAPRYENVLDVLKQTVLKWEEASNAINDWMPKVGEADRLALAERGRQYTRNARELREFIKQFATENADFHV